MNALLRPPVSIYTEASPNPNSIKFRVNFELVPDGLSFDFADASEAIHPRQNSPLAVALFGFEWVRRVFIARNFVTITKQDETDWDDVMLEAKFFLRDYFEAEKLVFTQQAMDANSTVVTADSETVQQIKAVLDQYIRPAVESDGGAISFASFNEETGLVEVQLQGSCSGCPSSTLTLKAGIENLMTRLVPGVKTVEAVGV